MLREHCAFKEMNSTARTPGVCQPDGLDKRSHIQTGDEDLGLLCCLWLQVCY